jgi:hypothetical protein
MSKDQGYGFLIFIICLIVAVVYLAMFFAPFIGLDPRLEFWALAIPVLLFVLLVLVIGAWIGWTMLTTPPPTPLETTPEPTTTPESKPEDDSTTKTA